MLDKVKRTNPIDVHVGSRIRLRRTMTGVSQEKLGEGLGITFQQVQKYEKGTNRVGASRLQAIADLLNVPVAYFFDGQDSRQQSPEGSAESDLMRFVATSEGLALNRAFAAIRDPHVRRRLVDLAKAIAGSETEEA